MEIEKKPGKVSFTEMILYFLAGLLLLFGFSYLIFTLIIGTPFGEIFDNSWMNLITTPILLGILLPFLDRTLTLTIESKDKSQIVWAKIVELLKRKEYEEIESTNNNLVFDYIKRWKRVINMNQGKVKLSMNEDFINVTGKRNILYQIECKVKYDNDINMS